MKFKHIRLLLIAACVLLLTGALAACRQSVLTRDDLQNMGYNCSVTFDLAGGTSGDGDRARDELHQYVKKGSPIIKPGDDQFSGEEPVRDGYTLGGYYRGTKAEDGTISYEEKWDFATDRVEDENLTLYARWREDFKIVVHYGETYEKAAVSKVGQTEDGVALDAAEPSVTGYTVIAFYATEAEAEAGDESVKLQFPCTVSDKFSEENTTWDIWANALEGNFKIVRTANDFRLYAGTNMYLLNNIDLGGKAVSFPDSYSGKFYGNGHTVSGFSVTRKSSAKGGDDYLGLFKQLTATAVIEDVTFADFTLNITAENKAVRYYLGALAGRAAAGATIRKVTLKGRVEYTIADQNDGEPVISSSIADEDEGVVKEEFRFDEVEMVDKKAVSP